MLFLNLSIYYAIMVQEFIFREFLEKINKYRDLKIYLETMVLQCLF